MIEFLDTGLRPAPILTVAFTGISHALGGLHFDFGKSLSGVESATLLVRDIGRRWYQYPNDSPNSPARVIERIRTAASEVGATRIVCLGNSMGGFGALMFGSLLQADAVLAFVPQTVIAPSGTEAMGDSRWAQYQRDIDVFPFGDIATMKPCGNVTICYSHTEPLDVVHVERLPWPKSEIVADGGHEAVATLKQNGKLVPLITSVISSASDYSGIGKPITPVAVIPS